MYLERPKLRDQCVRDATNLSSVLKNSMDADAGCYTSQKIEASKLHGIYAFFPWFASINKFFNCFFFAKLYTMHLTDA